MSIDPTVFADTLLGTDVADTMIATFPLRHGAQNVFSLVVLSGLGDDTLIATPGPANWPRYSAAQGDAITDIYVQIEMQGGEGNDLLVSSQRFAGLTDLQSSHFHHDEMLVGGAGSDTYVLRDSGIFISEEAFLDTDKIQIGSAYAANTGQALFNLAAYSGIERLVVTSAQAYTVLGNIHAMTITLNSGDDLATGDGDSDRLFGRAGNDTLWGDVQSGLDERPGDDSLYGQDGDDQLFGGTGADLLSGGTGNDLLSGGAGNDLLIVDDAGDSVLEQAGEGQDTVASASIDLNGDAYAGVEALWLTGGADLDITGNADQTALSGNAGGNLISTSSDTGVTLNGAGGMDTLVGGAGDDTLQGQSGRDLMFGGDGADVFLFTPADAAYVGVQSGDMVGLFQQGVDLIDLSTFGPLAISALSAPGVFDPGPNGHVLLAFLSTSLTLDGTTYAATRVMLEIDGDGLIDLSFTVFSDSALTLTLADFL